MGKVVKKVAGFALPVIGTALGGPLGGAIGGALGGAASGGGLKGALLGGATGFAGGGGLGNIASAGTSVAGSTALKGATSGSGLLGALSRGGSGFSSALRGVGSGLNTIGSVAKGVTGLLPEAGQQAVGAVTGGAGTAGAFDAGNVLSKAISGYQADRAAKKVEKAQLGANQQALSAISPYLQTGQSANARISELLGLDPDSDKDDILESLRNRPDYQFRQEQGQEALDRSLGARGGLFSGRAIKESQKFGQGLADQTYNQYLAQLNQQSNQGLNTAGAVGNLYGQQGDIQANALNTRNSALSDAIAGILTPRQMQDLEKKKLEQAQAGQ